MYQIIKNKKKLIEHFNQIYLQCGKSFMFGCGSYLFNGEIYKYDSRMLEKQELLYQIAKNNRNVLEIGTYMGHSLLIMLMANKKIKATCVDISSKYSLPSINYLKQKFKLSKIKFIEEKSFQFLKLNKKSYDLYHLDGDHGVYTVFRELVLCLKFHNKKNIKILFDDYQDIKMVIDEIKKNFIVKKIIVTRCFARNCYLEFDYDKKLLRKFLLRYYLNVVIYFFPIRVINYFKRNLLISLKKLKFS